jgi:hypothetical protein
MISRERILKEGYDNDVYENVWLPVGDDKNEDIERLIEQERIKG